MSRFQLRLTSTNLDECYVQNSIPGGSHTNLTIQKLPHLMDKKANKIHDETIQNHLKSLKNVEYKNLFDRLCKFWKSLEIFAENVENLKITDSTFDADSEFGDRIFEFPKLKSLKIERSFYGFIKLFNKAKVRNSLILCYDVGEVCKLCHT